MNTYRVIRWFAGLLAIGLLCAMMPAVAEQQQTLRIGFYAYDGYHHIAEDGTRSGYGYDVLQMMARYANVDYEYLGYDQTLEENKNMLEKGEIDLLTSVKWTEEMAERFDFSERSIGTMSTVLTVKAGNTRIVSGDYSTYDGIRIGFLKGSPREAEFQAYSQEKGFTYESVYYENTAVLAQALQDGEVDALASTSLRVVENEWTIESFYESPIYVIVRKGDTQTLALVNRILDRMEIEELNWRHEVQHKYHSSSQSILPLLTQSEREYLAQQAAEGQVFQVLVNPDRYPYSYVQEGQMVGIMVDLFDLIAQRVGLTYEWIIPENREDYAERMQACDTDICIDLTPDYYQAEINGYTITDAYLTAPFSWVRRSDHVGDIQLAAKLIYTAYTPAQFAYDNAYHDINYITYATHEECVQSVLDGETDGYCIYTYRAEQMVLDDLTGKLMASISHSENQFAIGVTRTNDIRLTTILNTTVDCIQEWETIGIIRKHTVFQQPEHTALDVILHNRQMGGLVAAIGCAVALLIALIAQQVRYQRSLKKTIRWQGDRLSEALQGMLDVLATAIEYRSSESGDHVLRIRGITSLLLTKLTKLYPHDYKLTDEQIEQISMASVLHDVGKIGIPDHILNKPGKLTAVEFETIKRHPIKGCELLERIPNLKDEPLYAYAWDICRWHHERWDGRGYPDGLKGKEIPIWAQAAAVADVYDALTNPRVYKGAYSREKAVDMIAKGECGLFNPRLVEAFQHIAEQLDAPKLEEAKTYQAAPAGRDLSMLMITAFQAMLDTTSDMIYLKDVDMVYRAVSPAFAKFIGRMPEEIVCRDDREIFEDEALVLRSIAEAKELLASGQDQIDHLEVYGERDGLPVYMSTSKYLLTDSEGRIMGILGIMHDVTSEFFTKRHYQMVMKQLVSPAEDVYFGVCIDVNSWRIVTERTQSLNGLMVIPHESMTEFTERGFANLVDRRGSVYKFYQNFSAKELENIYHTGQSEIVMEYQRRIDGRHIRWVRDEYKFLIDPHNGHLCVVLTERDIQQKKEEQQRMIDRAQRDPLTKLLNRSSMEMLIQQTLLEKNEGNVLHAMFMIDVDHFKDVNDTLGHPEGDKCLEDTAELLRGCFRASDLIARIGGDEFMVLMRYVTSPEAVRDKAELVRQMMDRMVGPKQNVHVSGSIGVSFYPANGTTADDLYAKADQALYQSKRKGKNAITFANE